MTTDMASWAERVPAVTDRALLELVNGVDVAGAVVAERAALSPCARFVRTVLGRERAGGLMTDRLLVDGQKTLVAWATELSERQAVTNLTVARVAVHLKETKLVALETRRRTDAIDLRLADLAAFVTELESAFGARLTELECWRAGVDLRLAADKALDGTLDAWRAGALYAGIGWPYQVFLLARDLAASACGANDLREGDGHYADRIANSVIATLKDQVPQQGFAIPAVLDEGWRGVADADDRWLLGEVLDAGLGRELTLWGGPLTAQAATTLELSSLAEDVRPPYPARTAAALTLRTHERTNLTATLPDFVRRVVAECMLAAAAAWRRAGEVAG